MTMPRLTTNGAAETEAVGEAIGSQLRVGDLVVLSGDLGAGKTTFTKGLARALGVEQRVTSPTFTIVQEYDGRLPVAHVDVYRLERIQELYDFGFEELLEDRVTVVEWGEAIALVLPRDRVNVRIELDETDGDDDRRRLEIGAHGPSWDTRRAHLDAALARFGAA
ncbi:MAG: TsaE protein required for threonylcarbamoyladenosine t(6)A37 formation in tRNA [Actinomycetia bacterium]|jgi:tRNA threonylcarbamoyladenosine biosynthesis protein TsaE|nr:TsaE protein required for threonylcarbamoyladenosine t(6)A37 formation in tRNA [Actinomycetes bacterium]